MRLQSVLTLGLDAEPTVETVDGLRDIESLEVRSTEHARRRITEPDEVARDAIDIPVLMLGWDQDELHGIFPTHLRAPRRATGRRRVAHPEPRRHGYIYPESDDSGEAVVDDGQREALDAIIDFFDRTSRP